MPWVAIESPTALKRTQEENCAAPVGTGPFKVESWKKQDAVNLVRNDDYVLPTDSPSHAGTAYLDGITWRFIPEAATRYAALQAGEVQIIDNAQPDAIAAAAKNDAIKHLDAPRPGASNRIELNSSKAPFNDVRVREAFIHSVNVNAGIDSLFFGTAKRSYSPLSSVEPLALQRGIALCLRSRPRPASCWTPRATPSAMPRATGPRTASASPSPSR